MASVPHLGMPMNFFPIFCGGLSLFYGQDKNICYQHIRWCFGAFMLDFCSDNLYEKICCLSFLHPRRVSSSF